MRPIYIQTYIPTFTENIFTHLLNELQWLEETEARKEYFMSDEQLSYQYGKQNRTYSSLPFSKPVRDMMMFLNNEFNCNYNVCFLNRYDNYKKALGWHADNSPEMNSKHDICVISFGAEREIWWKEQSYKGDIPKENRQLLHNGSLFIMPAGFQEIFFHKIPKSDKQDCGIRISLTFRNYIK